MLFANIGVLDERFDYHENWFVAVEGERIAYVGAEKPEGDFGEIYDGTGKVLLPAFVNAHSHSAMTLMRGYGENLALSDWLNTRIFPFEAKVDGEAIYNGAMLAAAEMLRFGIVSTTDMYFDAMATRRVVEESGIKMNLSVAAVCFDDSDYRDLPMYRELAEVLPACHGAFDGRMRMDAGLHAEYTTTEKVVRGAAEAAKELGLNMHLHLSETKDEHEACKTRHGGRTPAKYFYENGVFDVPTTAAHCVWVEEEDMDIFREKGVTVACNPVSNLKLASGFCPAKALLDKGVNVALGTDSVASNNSLNIMEEVKLFATLFKASTGDPTAVTPKQALYAATRAGALSQGRTDCGLVKEGFRADLVVMDVNHPYMRPCHDMVNNLVFSTQGTDVCLTMADGKVLYRNGLWTTIDVERTAALAEESVKKILSQL